MEGLKVVLGKSTPEGAFHGLVTKDYDQVKWGTQDKNDCGVNIINYISYKDGKEYFIRYLCYELVG